MAPAPGAWWTGYNIFMGRINKGKKNAPKPAIYPQQVRPMSRLKRAVRLSAFVFLGMFFIGGASIVFFITRGNHIAEEFTAPPVVQEEVVEVFDLSQFPVGVFPAEKEIIEHPEVDAFFTTHISKGDPTSAHVSWFGRALGKLALMSWYQNLASVSSRILVIESGERKEQVSQHFGKILGWSTEEKTEFLGYIEGTTPALEDGKFFPGTYSVSRGAKPADVAPLVLDRFNTEVLTRYTPEVEEVVPLSDTLVIASLLEREAYDFNDMRQISGVIWNRLFADMKLQIDATLQYAKGSKPQQPWWPRVVPSDKYIASVYNTYKNEGLPPAPIANPSLEAILAALNPRKTDCMYYFHDKNAGFHCSKTYEEHVALLKQYYGRGK